MTIDGEEQPDTTGTVTPASGQVAIFFTNTFDAPLPPTGLESRATVIALAVGFLVIAGSTVLVIGAMRRRADG